MTFAASWLTSALLAAVAAIAIASMVWRLKPLVC